MRVVRYSALLVVLILVLGFYSCNDDPNKSEHGISTNIGSFSGEISQIEPLMAKGDYVSAKAKLLSHLQANDTLMDTLSKRYLTEHLGIVYYQMQMVDSAIYYWRETEKIDGFILKKSERAANLSNLGSAYMMKGYYQTAISYFLEARSIFENLGEKSENYWVNHLNIGVSNMELRNYPVAEEFFMAVPDNITARLRSIKEINLAKLFALQGQESEFADWIQKAEMSVVSEAFYRQVFNEVLIEFGLEFGWKDRLKARYKDLLNMKGQGSVYLDIMLCELALSLGEDLPFDEEALQALRKEIPLDDFVTLAAYFQFQSNLLADQGEYKLSIQALKKCGEFKEFSESKKSRQDLLDITLLSERRDVEYALQEQIEQNELQSNRLKAQVYFILALVFLIVLLFVGGSLIYYKQKSKGRAAQEQVNLQNLQLEWVQQQQERLNQDLQYKNAKLHSVMNTVTKIAILKKQIDGFLKSLEEMDTTSPEYKLLLRKMKLDFTLFFNNYQDLAVIANLDGEEAHKLEQMRLAFPGLNENEQRVILLISQKYTSKEMATLLSCSEKNIEYYRTQIRKKLSIEKEDSISEFIEKHLN